MLHKKQSKISVCWIILTLQGSMVCQTMIPQQPGRAVSSRTQFVSHDLTLSCFFSLLPETSLRTHLQTEAGPWHCGTGRLHLQARFLQSGSGRSWWVWYVRSFHGGYWSSQCSCPALLCPPFRSLNPQEGSLSECDSPTC